MTGNGTYAYAGYSDSEVCAVPFDLSMTKLLVLGLIALVIFGPDKLPQVARDAGRMIRQFKAIAQQARSDLKSELGDTVGDFDFEDLNPRTFVRKHLLDDGPPSTAAPAAAKNAATNSSTGLPGQAIVAAGVAGAAAVAHAVHDQSESAPDPTFAAASEPAGATTQVVTEVRPLVRFDPDAT